VPSQKRHRWFQPDRKEKCQPDQHQHVASSDDHFDRADGDRDSCGGAHADEER
jgi:hypothetical protein